MTENQKLSMLRVMIGETSRTRNPEDDETLSAYLTLAAAKILERLYPYVEDYSQLATGNTYGSEYGGTETVSTLIPTKHEPLQLKIAAYMLNKRGAEGEVQHIENGVHRNYGDADIPEAMLAGLAPFVGIPK